MDGRRDPVVLTAAAAVLLATLAGAIGAAGWIGRPFPGFLVLENRVVASAGLRHWPGTAGGEIFQHEVVAVEGRRVASASALRTYVEAVPVGTVLSYRFRADGSEIERRIATRRFAPTDFVLLFGAYLFCGLGLAGMAVGIRFLRGSDQVAVGSALCLWIVGMYALTALDLYGPYRFFRVHALLESFLFAGTLHMAMVFPVPWRAVRRRPVIPVVPYALAAALAVVTAAGLHWPESYVVTHRIAVSAFGVSLLALLVSQVSAYLRPPSLQARQRVKVLTLGALGALTPQVILSFASALSGGGVPENTMGWSGVLFPVAVGYAVLREDLLEVDSVLRRTANYVLMTLVVALVYGVAVAGFEALFRTQSSWARGVFTILFVAVTMNLLLPLRDRVQAIVDRLFFRSAYDFRRHVEEASARMTLVTQLQVVGHEIARAVGEALHPEWLALWVRRQPEAPFEPLLRRGEGARERPAQSGLADDGTSLDVPFRVEGQEIARLALGRRLSGRFYGAEDRALLLTLANQGAVAIRNALALDELRELNEGLETKVQERTSELARTLHELRETQAQLVHREKMASLGQFVAGIAHEMNNPMNFIQTNLHFLKRYSDVLVDVLGRYEALVEDPELRRRFEVLREERDLDTIIEDLRSVHEGCAEGVVRTTSLVEDLRQFSRLDLPQLTPVDLHAALDSTLNLLSGRLGGARVVKRYAELPAVECLAGQINQVFMNLLANAADAVQEGGTITIRTERVATERVAIEVEDDGCGIAPDLLDRIFDPFFTTKEVGKGTGLGLAITYGVVERHGGSIRVHSQPEGGTRFRVELPIHAAPELPEPHEDPSAKGDPDGSR